MNQDFEKLKRKFWVLSNINEDYLEEWAVQAYETYHYNVPEMAAFITILNYKSWYWYDRGNEKLSKIYSELYYKYNELEWNWLETYGTEEEKSWYFNTLD